ncbi:acyl carrier protein [Streptomyces sp. B4I13]|uniref:condensation domain-containing protein n=1 Tax=Streptomyces sp. B4I13 TaxID=3042271 RepID=UPI00277F98B1|nr:condensation domain-containing protein [Streptomyces sp. B4I13]MDQ0958583.1 acyl carrier protein [Streptomyces sp. B4I13]
MSDPVRAALNRQQYGIWILQNAAPDSAVGNIPFAFRTRTALRWWPLNRAVDGLVARHEALRSRFPVVDGAPVREVLEPDELAVPLQVCAVSATELPSALGDFAHQPFDLVHDLPFRVRQYLLDDGGSVVCLVLHHIVGDASSGGMLVEELARMYDRVAADNELPPELAVSFPYVPQPPARASSLAYWRERLADVRSAAMTLPGSRPRPDRLSFAGDVHRAALSHAAADGLEQLRHRLKVTPNIVMMTAFLATLARHGLGPDLTVGVPVNARDPRRHGLGLGVNTLALRVRAEPDDTFAELVHRTRGTFLEGLAHADVTVESVLDDIGHRFGDWRSPLFRQVFNWRTFQPGATIAGELPEFIEVPAEESQFELQLAVAPGDGPPQINAIFSTDVHERDRIEALVGHLDEFLVVCAADPGTRVGGPRVIAPDPPWQAGPERPAGAGTDQAPTVTGQGEEIVAWLLKAVEDLVGRRIEPDLDMFDQGLTSARAVRLITALEAEYGVEIGIRPLFEEGTVEALTEAVIAALDARPASDTSEQGHTEGEHRR